MESYESDIEGDEQDTPLLPEAHREKHQTAHKGDFLKIKSSAKRFTECW